MILLSLATCPTLGCCLNLDMVMMCMPMSNLPSPVSQISCPTIVWHCLIWSWSQNSDRSICDLLLLVVSLSSLAFPLTFSHRTQESCQHISLDLQQEFNLQHSISTTKMIAKWSNSLALELVLPFESITESLEIFHGDR